MRAPAVVVVGAVVSLRKKLAWWESRPLAGKRIILTASESLRKGWREEIESLGAEVWEIPMTRTVALPPQKYWKEQIKDADWLVFTSAAGVRAFPGVVWDWRKISHCQIAAVGKSTAEVLRSIGLQPDWIGGGPGSRELVKGWPRWAKGKILHLTGDAGSGKMVELFRKKGFSAERLVIYQNSGTGPIPQPVRIALSKSGADWVVFASGTAAERFRKAVPNWSREPKVVVIGPATARAARQAGWRVRAIAHEPSAARVLDAILHRS
jgi:uroporphyrinogen III methyltransferase/synthase